MALIDLIASGNTDIPSFAENYQAGLRQMREGKAAEQTATLRDLQIGQAQKEASTWEEDRALDLRAKRAATAEAEQQQQWSAEDRPAEVERQRVADEVAKKQAAQFDVQAQRETEKFQSWKTDTERKEHLYGLEETERHITAAIESGDPVGYITENADAIKEVGGDEVDTVVDKIVAGEVPPPQMEQLIKTLQAQGPARQKLLTDLKLLDYEYGKKAEVTAAGEKPGTATGITGPIRGQIEATVKASDKFKNLEGSYDSDDKVYSKEQGKAMTAFTNTIDSIRQNTARIRRKELDDNVIMQALKEEMESSVIDDPGYNSFNSDRFNRNAAELVFILSNEDNKVYTTQQLIDHWKGIISE